MKHYARRKARRLALQALYQWQFNANQIEEIKEHFLQQINAKKIDLDYFLEIFTETINNLANIDNNFLPNSDRQLKDINPVELAILRLATYELIYRLDVPHKVIINEALESVKIYGAEDSYKFINSVLDRTARKVRS